VSATSGVALLEIDLPTDNDGASAGLRGILGIPAGDGPWPAVVVVHEIFGIDDEMRKQVEYLASLGYLALMPDLFSAGGFRRCISATMRSLSSGTGAAYVDIEVARDALLARSDCTGAIGVIGFCMGGGFALMAANRGFDAAAVNYGMLPKDLDLAVAGACPVVTSYGGSDVTLKGATAKLDAALTRQGVPHDSKEYPGAGHVFMNDRLSGPGWLRPIVRTLNFGPKPEAAADAWRRIDDFFTRYLVTPER